MNNVHQDSVMANSASRTSLVEVSDLSITYDGRFGKHLAVSGVNFDVRPEELIALVGPSGAGKTTILRCIAGLLSPDGEDSIKVDGKPIKGPTEGISVVFQDYSRSLLAWLTLQGNVMLPLRAQGVPRAEAKRRAREALADVGLGGKETWHPWQLSGGMQQRVAIARGLACNPRILLMDEPFASVDAQTRMDLEDLVLKIKNEFKISIIVVTHDIDEAVYLADRVVVLSKSPSTVSRILDVDFPTPRTQEETRVLPEFGEIRAVALDLVRHPKSETI